MYGVPGNGRDRSPVWRGGGDPADPKKANARIFIGGLNPSITQDILTDHFSRWGDVLDVVINKNNFGFIQFRQESEALGCLASGYQTLLNGVRIDVKPAKAIGQYTSHPPLAPGLAYHQRTLGDTPGPSRGGGWSDTGLGRDLRLQDQSRDASYYNSYYRNASKGKSDDQTDSYLSSSDYYSREGNGYYRSESRDVDSAYMRSNYDDYTLSSEPFDDLDSTRPNDAEIVVPHKMQRAYAENIERKLKQCGLLVDLLFPPPDITPERVITDLMERQCLYVIFITADNEKHNSLTLNILHGVPQEHRNMPTEDAMRLIEQNFGEYVKKSRLRNMREVVPREIRNLLRELLEMRPLSMGDLDQLIKYLRERQNALVNDQIEQKRETAGHNQSASAVTYPGYNYITTTATHAAAVGAPSAVISAGGHPTAVPGSLSIVTAPSVSAAAAAYPAYSTIQGLATPTITTAQLPATVLPAHAMIPYSLTTSQATYTATPAAHAQNTAKQTEMELQERILSIMKGTLSSGLPTGVPPPSVVPPPRQQSIWVQSAPLETPKSSHANDAPYNPWAR